MRRLFLCVALCAVGVETFAARPAGAQKRDLCLGPYGEGQELRQKGRLRAARDVLRTCARDACPPAVRVDCAQWGTEVEAALPTVTVRARDPRGQDVAGLRVLVDGELVASYEDGRPFELDPGPHVVRVEAAGGSADIHVVAREGEKARPLEVTLGEPVPAPAPPPPPAPTPHDVASRPVPTSVWLLGALGVVGLGSFATFGLLGHDKHDALRQSCAPNCTSDQEAPIRIDYAIGDISLAVSLISFGAATWLFVTRPKARAAQARALPWTLPLKARVGGAF